MSAFYEELRAEVDDLLSELGRRLTYTRHTYTVDLVEGTSVPAVSAQQQLLTATVPIKERNPWDLDLRFMDDVGDVQDSKLAIVSAEGAIFQPSPKDEVELGGRTWQVVGCTAIDIDGTPVAYVVGMVLP